MTLAKPSPSITPFYFIRHAQVCRSPSHLPAYDPPITTGPFQLASLIKDLPANADWHISPMLRTRQTADLLRSILTPNSERLDNNLIEQSFGIWHGQKIENIWAQIKDGPKHNWGFLMPNIRPPEGESFDDQILRVASWCNALEKQHYSRPQIIFTHVGTIRAVLAHILSLSSTQAYSIAIANLSYFHANLMNDDHARNHSGGSWQLQAISPPTS